MQARATVIVPTFGEASFARWAVKSVQQQTVKEIEICIICDGSPPEMVSFFQRMAEDDLRIRVFSYPKSKRTGEPYRDEVIKQTTGKVVCYCCHDDLWLPDHIETIEETLKEFDFTHTLHAIINTPENIEATQSLFADIYWINLQDHRFPERMQNKENFFGLTFGAHTRESYNRLEEGWITTPHMDIPTDLYMWNKFLSKNKFTYKTTMKITALNFPVFERKGWSQQKRGNELQKYFNRIQDPSFSIKALEILYKRYQNEKKMAEIYLQDNFKLESEIEALHSSISKYTEDKMRLESEIEELLSLNSKYTDDNIRLENEVEALHSSISKCTEDNIRLESEITALHSSNLKYTEDNIRLESEIEAIHSTVSWRVTKPLRYLRTIFKHWFL